MQTIRYHLSVLLLLLTVLTGYSQQLYFKQYPFGRKLKEGYPTALLQSTTGMLWVGTNKGLLQFDGKDFQLIGEQKEEVTALGESHDGTIWVGFKDGALYFLKEEKLQPFETDEGMAVEAVSDIVFDKDGTLWFATLGDGLYYYKNERMYRLDEEDGLPDTYIYDLELDKQGNIWAGTDGGIAVCHLNEQNADIKVIDSSLGLPDDIVKKIIFSPENESFWIGTEDEGLFSYDPSTQVFKPVVKDEWPYGSVLDMTLSGNELWVSTSRQGILVMDCKDQSILNYTKEHGLSSGRLHALMGDREGNIWLAGRQRGLERLPANRLWFFRNMSEQVQIVAVGADQHHALWYLNHGKLYHYQQGKATLMEELPAQVTAISLYVDPYNNKWIGTYGDGIYCLKENGTLLHYKEELPDPNIINITGDGDAVWLATLRGGCRLTLGEGHKPSQIDVFGTKEGLGTDYLYQVFVDSQKRVWFGTDGHGISLMEQEHFQQLDSAAALDEKVIYGFAEDGKQRIWINVKGEGLYCFTENGKLKHYGIAEGLRDLDVKILSSDINGNLLVFHEAGLDVFDIQEEHFVYLGAEDGISEEKPFQNAVGKNAFGEVYFGTDKGIVGYRQLNHVGQRAPELIIEEIKLFGKELLTGDAFKLKHNQNHLTINFEGLWYGNPEGLRFRYQLEGYDMDWIYTSSNSLTYSYLPPGHYLFKVQTSYDPFFKNFSEAQFTLEIAPPFWKEPWFILLAVGAMLGLIYWAVKRRERQLKLEKQLLEEKVKERTEEITLKNEELQAAFEDIENKNDKITKSINYAKRIQQAILPLRHDLEEAFPNHFVLYQPRDIVSGDFYWVTKQGDKTFFAAVDCTGHGVPGAFMSMIGASVLNEAVKEPDITPKGILNKMDQAVVAYLKQDGVHNEKVNAMDGMDISLICWEPKEKRLTYAGAKRPLYMIQEGELKELKGDRWAIGGHGKFLKDDCKLFTDHTIIIDKPTSLYLSSDGYADQFGGPNNKKFTTKKLKQLLLELSQQTPEKQELLFAEEIERWKGGCKQTDDILFAGIFLNHEKAKN
ncbi:two-component regulator propeller domain-containing protein [Limibacter armeniacum]|uniref:two-component regulator propeller domain-containing protein n=1 Tax=Limibacter armeniacum TaxID=466084 RepID=UPI002FE5EC72